MKFKKLSATILTLIMLLVLCPVVSAESNPSFVVSEAAAKPGDEVTINISIANNPGIMSMAFSVTYDQNNLEFLSYIKGWISTPTYKDHASKGYVAFNVVESSAKQNVGSVMSLTFKIKDDAEPGNYKITLGNHFYETSGYKLDNCFSNADGTTYSNPDVKAGSITVLGPCDISGHTNGEWVKTKESTCTEMGIQERTCSVCGEIEQKKLPFVHDFEDEWTVDKVATPEENGVMSRHCKLCDEITDRIIFRYDEITTPDDDTTTPDDSSSGEDGSGNASEETGSDGTSDSTSSEIEENNKPVIDNTEGAKNPIEEVEKLEDFENLPQTDEPEVETSDKEPIEDTADDTSSTQDTTTETEDSTTANTEESEENKPFLSTPIGIITITLCALLSCGIIAFGIMLILKNKKTETTE